MPAARCLCLIVLLLASIPAHAAAQGRLLFGELEAGAHAVGFRTMALSDPSRPIGPKSNTAAPADRARKLTLHVWYPAAAAGTPALTMTDYIRASDSAGQPAGSFATEYRPTLARFVGVPFSDDDWSRYSAIGFAGVRDAPPAAGRFPLLVGLLRPVSVVAMGEYLASHGYVAAFVQKPAREEIAADGPVLQALVMAQQIRDMELAIAALREQPFVHPAQLGALGYSTDGLPQLVLAMRHPDVDAVSLLESGFISVQGANSYQAVTAYDPSALRAAMLYVYSEQLGRNTDMHLAEIDRMRYAPRYRLYLGEPWMLHSDFATEGIAATMIGKRAEAKAGVLRAFQAAQRYQLRFFDAFVKRDDGAKARLREALAPPGKGAMIEIVERPAVVPAMSRPAFRAQLASDPARAMQQAREGLSRDPQAAVFDETWLNATGYELLQGGDRDRAIHVFMLNAEAHAGSANALDSLSEALEAAGRHAEALPAAEKALAALPADRSVPAAQRASVEAGLKARIARLKK